jgi:3-phosphoshikimate 1-carboxyvinyltransferase
MKIYKKSINGQIKIPASKSIAQRAIAAATLANGLSVLNNISFCDDTIAATNIAKSLGAKIKQKNSSLLVSGNFNLLNDSLFVNESGLSTRMFLPIAALLGKNFYITGTGTILKRPMKNLVIAMKNFDVCVKTSNGFLPLKISGKLKHSIANIDASDTSQLLTGLLMALPLTSDKSELYVSNLKSKPYIDLTISILNKFGIQIENSDYQKFVIEPQKYIPSELELEGDWSNAAFWFAAAAIAGNIKILNLNPKSKQADIAILKALNLANVDVEYKNNAFIVQKSKIKNFDFDASDCPDLFPPLAILAAFANGTSKIKGVYRLLHKESNRAKAIVSQFSKLNIPCKIDNDYLIISGVKNVPSAKLNSFGDHRMAMTAAILALKSADFIDIENHNCVSKSYPLFFDHLKSIS